jgi:hypothetical protein
MESSITNNWIYEFNQTLFKYIIIALMLLLISLFKIYYFIFGYYEIKLLLYHLDL